MSGQAESPKGKMLREWIIFALCLGLGGHVALGMILHAPHMWQAESPGLYVLLIGVMLYVVLQLARSLWWFLRADRSPTEAIRSQK